MNGKKIVLLILSLINGHLVHGLKETYARHSAHGFLARHPRSSNKYGLEEFHEGNMERECIEESCSPEELTESLDRYEKHVSDRYTKIFYACEELSNDVMVKNRITLEGEFDAKLDKKEIMRRCVHSEVSLVSQLLIY